MWGPRDGQAWRAVRSDRTVRDLTGSPGFIWMARIALGLTVGLIVFASLQPASGRASIAHLDKVYHLIAYSGVVGLARMGFPLGRLSFIIAAAIAMGVGVELAQGAMALGRTASVADGIANAFGAFIAGLTFRNYNVHGPAENATPEERKIS